MKTKILSLVLFMGASLVFSSCATMFTSTKQEVTFTGENGIGIYDNSKKLGEIKDETLTVKIKKRTSSKKLLAKKEGYVNTPVVVESVFSPISLLNLLFWPGFIVDFATGQMFKYDDDVIQIDMRKRED